MINLVTGNLLKDSVDALVNTVNTKGIMGKGIALQFKQAYPDMFKKYEFDCKHGDVRLGKVHIYDNGALADGPRWIINFPTKDHWKSKSKINDIEAGLIDLAKQIEILGIRSIAIPPLGCGLGGLRWSEVYSLIETYLGGIKDVDIHVYPPSGAPEAKSVVIKTKKPNMTKSTAALILLIEKYLSGQLSPFISLLEIHKLMYFLQNSGEDLKLNFEAKPYGPYAKNLRHIFIRVDGHYLEGYGDGYDGPQKPLNLKPGAIEEAEEFLQNNPSLIDRLEKVAHLIEGFEDPYGLELLSTVHWVINRELPSSADDSEEAMISSVQSWSDRKERIMKPIHLRKAHEHLKQNRMLH